MQTGTLGWLAEGLQRPRRRPGALSAEGTRDADDDGRSVGLPPVSRRRRSRPASTEAADFLLAHGPETDPYNLYYWYYGTLAMYQHGGDAWFRWNAQVRDEIVRRQRPSGHAGGSWDPDDSPVWRERRADLLHGARHAYAGGVLPLLAPL